MPRLVRAPTPTGAEQALTPGQGESIEAAAGIPPVPDQKSSAAFLAALEKINPELVEGRDPAALLPGVPVPDECDPPKAQME